jgi:hypothetical protein
MAIDFGSLLTDEQKASLIQQRISQFAAEAYQHSLNRVTAEKLGAEDQVASADKNLELLEAAIDVHKAELAKLSTPVVATESTEA